MLPEFFEFHNPTKLVYGAGMALDLQPELAPLGVTRFFLVSDAIISGLGIVDKIINGLEEAGMEVCGTYLEVPQDAVLANVIECAEKAKAAGAEAIIAVGGGSVIDAAKGANILISVGGDLMEDYSGAQTLTQRLKPLVVIPTTAGTGSEVTQVAVIYDKENKVKNPFTDKFLLPTLAVLDPELSVSMPPGLTASTGMDALTHAVEAYLGIQNSPTSDYFALGAIELVFKHIVTATKTGDDLEARGGMLVASALAGISFSHSMVGCVHGMAHATGGIYRVPHGVANGIFLPHGMEYNFEECKDRMAKLAPFMGVDVSGLSEDQAARAAIAAVRKLTGELNALGALPIRLRDVGVPEDGLAAIAEGAVNDGTSFYNPREVVADEILENVKNAY